MMASLSMGARGSSLRIVSSLSFHSAALARSFSALSCQELEQASYIQRAHLIFTVAPSAPVKLGNACPPFSFSSSFCSSASGSAAAPSSAVTAEVNEQESEEESEDWDEEGSDGESEDWDEHDSEERPAEVDDSDDHRIEEKPALSPRTRSLIHRKFPPLSPKEKKDLRAYAHSLGKKIVSQQIGKAGVTEPLAKAISDALEAKEIVKLKVLSNCPDELDEVIVKIEEATQGQVVGKIGSVITLYRPSRRKQLKETRKLQNNPALGRPRKMARGIE